MEVENLLKEQVNLLKSSFTDDVINAILKENPEFKKYMDFQNQTLSDVTSAVNIELNKENSVETPNLKKSDVPTDLKKSEVPIDLTKSEVHMDLKKSQVPIDLKKSEVPIDLKKSEVPIDLTKPEIPNKLSGITIKKVNKNVENPSSNSDSNVSEPQKSGFTSKVKETVTITKSANPKKFLTKRCWYDGNEYDCASCNLVLFQYSSFKPHLQKFHQLTPAKINELSTKAKTLHDSKKYKCNICKMYIFHDKKDIMTHLEKVHKMSLKTYEDSNPQPQDINSQNKGKETIFQENKTKNVNMAHIKLNTRKSVIINKSKTKEGINESLPAENNKNEGIKVPKTEKVHVDKSENENLRENGNNIKKDKEPENCGTKRKLEDDKNDDKENKNDHANKKSKSEGIEKLNAREQGLLKENQTNIKNVDSKCSKDSLKKDSSPVGSKEMNDEKDEFKSKVKGKVKEEIKIDIGETNSNEKEITYPIALVQNCSEDIKTKDPKEKSEDIESKGPKQKENTTQYNSTKKTTFNDPKIKTTQKPFQKYGQKYKESINYSQIFNEPNFQTSRCWYDGIEYQCSFCNNIFFEIVNFRGHIKKSHELPTEVINEICIDAKKTHDNSEYECMICQATIVYEKNDIRIHLKTKHSLSLKQYEEMDIPDQVKISVEKGLSGLSVQRVNKGNSSLDSTPDTAVSQSSTEIKKKWFEDTMQSEKYKCKVSKCSSKIKRHKKNISDHLRKVHSLTLQDYEKIHENHIDDLKVPSVAVEAKKQPLESSEQPLESTEQPISVGDGENEYHYNEEYEYEDSYDFDEDFFAKKYFCPLESCSQIMYQEDIESGTALDHFKFDHYLTVEDIADNLAHLEDIVLDNDESVERVNYSCPIKECNFILHQTLANSSALAMHLGFQHQMSYDEVLLNLFYFANLIKREVAKEIEDDRIEEEKEEDCNQNIILRKSVKERKIYMRGIEISRKEKVFDCRVCKCDPMSEGAADLHLHIHHGLTPQQIKINLGVIVL